MMPLTGRSYRLPERALLSQSQKDLTMKRAIALGIGLLALASPAAADSPVAVVEEIQGKVTGAEFMDYVTPRSVIKIADGGSVVLGFLKSCRRETISGAGTVVVGNDESIVDQSVLKAE